MYVTAIDLAPPTIAYFDLTVSSGCSVSDHKMIGQSVLHPAHVAVIVIEDPGVALASAAVVHDNELPPTPFHGCASDGVNHGSR